MSAYQVWILDDDSSIRWVLERAFTADAGWQPRLFAEPEALLTAMTEVSASKQATPDLVITDVKMPGLNGMEVLRQLQQQWPDLPVIVMTAHSDLDSAVKAFKGGAFEYLPKPFDLHEMLAVASRAVKAREQDQQIGGGENEQETQQETGIVGDSPAMQEVFRAIGRLSRSSVTVLLTGETGTGKELVARALHDHSPRAEKPFVALNMAAIPSELIESELFGHEKGAFTGAQSRRPGRFQQADGGTLFLDEIGDMPLAVQTRLLRALAEGQFYPVGSHQLVTVDVRVIAATHIDLRKAISDGDFREDLYHRLNVIHLQLPSLAQRRSDIPALTEHFLARAAEELQMPVKRLSKNAMATMTAAAWPGNVRQLENACRWITVMASGDLVDVDELPQLTRGPSDGVSDATDVGLQTASSSDWQTALRMAIRDALAGTNNQDYPNGWSSLSESIERIAIEEALATTGGHRQQAAERLGWGRNTLTRKISRLGLNK